MATKKQQREERQLAKTVRQMESVAAGIKAQDKAKEAERVAKMKEMGLDPFTAGAENCSIVCPECGQLVPSPYSGFVSQEAADKYALEHCDCQKIKKSKAEPKKKPEELMPREQLLGILFTSETGRQIRVPAPPPPPTVGACRYCGQTQSVVGCKNDAEAEEQATRRCRCPSAVCYQDKLEAQRRRADALREAADNIDDLFGIGASDRGDEAVGENALEMLKQGAELVYDQKIVNQQLSLTCTIKAKIGRSSKGNLSIERKDTTTSKMEV